MPCGAAGRGAEASGRGPKEAPGAKKLRSPSSPYPLHASRVPSRRAALTRNRYAAPPAPPPRPGPAGKSRAPRRKAQRREPAPSASATGPRGRGRAHVSGSVRLVHLARSARPPARLACGHVLRGPEEFGDWLCGRAGRGWAFRDRGASKPVVPPRSLRPPHGRSEPEFHAGSCLGLAPEVQFLKPLIPAVISYA